MSTGRFHWSNCAPPAVFVKINAVASLPWLALALHPSWNVLYTAFIVTGVLLYIEFVKKMTVSACLRALNIWFTGRIKSTRNLISEFVG